MKRLKHFVLRVVILCLIMAQVAASPAALALESDDAPAAEQPAMELFPVDDPVPIILLYVPYLYWDQINVESTPYLYQLVADSASGNLISNNAWVIDDLEKDPYVTTYLQPYSLKLAQYDATVGYLLDTMDPRSLLIVAGSKNFRNEWAPQTYSPIIIHGQGYEGYLSSDTTDHPRLVTTRDVSALVRHINYLPDSPDYSVATITSHATDDAADDRLATLIRDRALCDDFRSTKPAINIAFLVLTFFTFVISIFLIFLHFKLNRKTLDFLIPLVRILWLIILSYPPATFLMHLTLPSISDPLLLMLDCAVWAGAIVLIALLIGRQTRWIHSLTFLFALTVLVVVIDQLLGGLWTHVGYITYDILEGSRFDGLGNEPAAMLYGAWFTLSGLLVNRFPTHRLIAPFKRWIFLLVSFSLLLISCLPMFGSSFGPIVWALTGTFYIWWLINERPVTLRVVLLAIGIPILLALGVLYLDLLYNPLSHMRWIIPSAKQGLAVLLHDMVFEAWQVSLNTTLSYAPWPALVFIAVVVALMAFLRLAAPGPYEQFWQRNVGFRAAFTTGLIIVAITLFIEDSGILTPSVYLIYMMSCFVWLICDLHSWRLREELRGSVDLSLSDLQRNDRRNGHPSIANSVDPMESLDTVLLEDVKPITMPTDLTDVVPLIEETNFPVEDNSDGDPQPSVGRSTATFATVTLLSRATGFLRTMAFAFALGNTLFSSAYYISNNLPNMLYELVAGGVLTTAFLPLYLAQREKRGKQGAADYASNLLGIALITLGAVSLLATIFAPQVIWTQTFMTQDQTEQIEIAVFFFRFFAIQAVFYGVGAILSGLLNAHRIFFWSALAPVFNNIVVIITFLGFPFISSVNLLAGMIWLAVGTTLGVVAMLVIQIPAFLKLNIPLRFKVNLKDPALRETVRIALPATIFIIMNLLVVAFMNSFSLAVADNGPSTLSFAWLWYQLPYGVIGVALSTTLFTEMSAASAAEDWQGFKTNVSRGLRTTIFLITPMALLLFALSHQLAGLYHAGQFNYQDVMNVAQVLSVWCFALPFYSGYMYLYRAFSSLRDLKLFIKIDAVGRVFQALLYGFFTTGFGLWDGIGLIGIPVADIITYCLLFLVMNRVLQGQIGSFGLEAIFKDGAKIFAASAVAAIFPTVFARSGFNDNIAVSLIVIIVCGSAGLGIYYLICRMLKIPEVRVLNDLLSRIGRRLHRSNGGR